MELREVLEGMLDVLHEKDWIKNHLYKIDGLPSLNGFPPGYFDLFTPPVRVQDVQGACLEGACNLVLIGHQVTIDERQPLKNLVNDHVLKAAIQSCPEKVLDYMQAMFQFNDLPETDLEDVILAVKTAIANLEGDNEDS